MGLRDGEEKNCVSWWPSLARLVVDSLILRVRHAGTNNYPMSNMNMYSQNTIFIIISFKILWYKSLEAIRTSTRSTVTTAL